MGGQPPVASGQQPANRRAKSPADLPTRGLATDDVTTDSHLDAATAVGAGTPLDHHGGRLATARSARVGHAIWSVDHRPGAGFDHRAPADIDRGQPLTGSNDLTVDHQPVIGDQPDRRGKVGDPVTIGQAVDNHGRLDAVTVDNQLHRGKQALTHAFMWDRIDPDRQEKKPHQGS